MSEKSQCTVVLKQRQLNYLKQMAEKYDIEDESKVLRCLIDFAIEKSDLEKTIFTEIRCVDC